MKLNYHNKINIKIGENEYNYLNTMLGSVYEKIANLESFFDKIAIGTGNNENILTNCKLGAFLKSFDLKTSAIQNSPEESSLFIKKSVVLEAKNFNTKYITEAGITSNLDNEVNPTVYNYFSFITNDNPNGILLTNDPIILTITIYLNLDTNSLGLFTKGNNQFISFLLGNGAGNKSISVARGEDLSENVFIERTNDFIGNKFNCTLSTTIENGLTMLFEGDLKSGETNELVFFLNDNAFARINTSVLQNTYSSSETFSPKNNYVVDLGRGIVDVESVVNNSNSTVENKTFTVKYASNFASKITLPFNNLFDVNTKRFLSKDGDKIFFVLNDYIYMYQNENFKINLKFSINPQIPNILKISAFDNFVFVFSKTSPYVFPYVIENNTLIKCNIDLTSFEYNSYLEQFLDIDMVQGNNDYFLLGFYAPVNTTSGYTLYYTFDNATKSFIFSSYLSATNYNFAYLLGFHKNNFSDAQIMYLQPGEKSSLCKRAIHKADKTVQDTYSATSYYYTYLTTALYVKSRAVIIEKNYNPNFWVYYYPQVYRFELSQFSEAVKSYISTNLLYLVQKLGDGTYRAFNLVGYNTPEEFSEGIPKEIDQSKILFVEFLIDTILFFMDDENEPIIAYNLNLNGTCIENVSSKSATYTVTLTRKETLGANNQGVIAKLAINLTIWFFQLNIKKFRQEQIFHFFQ